MAKDKGSLAALIVGKMKPKEDEVDDAADTATALDDASSRMMAAQKEGNAAGFTAALQDFLDIRDGLPVAGEDDE